jgi:SAM-dependent methyltransferase
VKRCVACDTTWDSPAWSCPSCPWEPLERDGVLAFAPDLDESTGEYDAELSRLLVRLEPHSFWFRARNRLLLQVLGAHFAGARSLLEIGCGTGFVLSAMTEEYPRLRVAGGELLAAGLEPARERLPEAELFQLDARRLPWRDEWDVLGAFDVLEHIDEDEAVLAEMRAASAQGGGVIITVPQHPWLWSGADDLAHHKRRYTRKELVSKVSAAGFTVTRVTSFVATLLPVMAASRFVRRGSDGDHDLEAELCPPAPVSALFESSLRAELALIRRGVSLPAGGSLLLVARRRD